MAIKSAELQIHPAVNETKPEDAQRGRINEANEGISE